MNGTDIMAASFHSPTAPVSTPTRRRRAWRRFAVVLSLMVAGAGFSIADIAQAKDPLLDELVEFNGAATFLRFRVPGLVIGAVRNGEMSIAGFGKRTDDGEDPPGADTVMRIGSITKAFTGEMLARLAADGAVALSDPLTKYVPAFAGGSKENAGRIRLIDLATHSGGLPRELPREPGPPDNPMATITEAAFAKWMKSNALLFKPGTAVLYSNMGFDLLSAALSRAGKKPYATMLAERITRPLKMSDTTFKPTEAQKKRLLQGHGFDGKPLPHIPNVAAVTGSGGLYATPRDLLRWLQWHLDRFSTKEAEVRLLDHAAYLWRDGLNIVAGMDESGRMDALGLAWVVMMPQGDRPLILQKAGGLQGVFTYIAFAPTRGVGVFVAINKFDFAAAMGMAEVANELITSLAPR